MPGSIELRSREVGITAILSGTGECVLINVYRGSRLHSSNKAVI